MNQQFPPTILVKTWLDLIQYQETPSSIKQLRIKEIIQFFGSTELACVYIEQQSSYIEES